MMQASCFRRQACAWGTEHPNSTPRQSVCAKPGGRASGLIEMRDPYTVLGVAKTADAAEIKKAFRKLAKKYHPDQSSDPKAKERFAEVSAAYEIIGDEKKRGAFDRGDQRVQ